MDGGAPTRRLQLFVRAIVRCYRVGRRRSGSGRAVLRVMASMRMLLFPMLFGELVDAGFYLDLHRPGEVRDPFPFFTSQRYLMRRLACRQRIRAYVSHRAFESAHRRPVYFDEVYRGDGLRLWHHEVDGMPLCLRLEPSEERDRNEGELSVVLRVAGDVCCRVSFSYVPADRFDTADEPTARAAMLIARSQTLVGAGLDRFNAVLPNDSARMYTLAAVSGIALADDFERVRGIHEAEQVGFRSVLSEGFRRSYTGIWEELPGARPAVGHTVFSAEFPATADAPIQARNRSRARRRRRNWDAIRDSARATVAHCR